MEHVEEEAYTESGDAMSCLLNPRQDEMSPGALA